MNLKQAMMSFLTLIVAIMLVLSGCGNSRPASSGGGGIISATQWIVQLIDAYLNTIASGSAILVSLGCSGIIKSSADGINWTIRTSGTINHLNSVTWSGTRFVAVGNMGTFITSP